jgi:uncharacterized protein with HEPN domain
MRKISQLGTLDAFTADEDAQDVIMRRLTLIGDAASRISQGFRDSHPQIPLRKMTNLRNALTHDYDRIDLELVWEIATVHLPVLLHDISPLIPPEGPDQP